MRFLVAFPASRGCVWWQYTELSILANPLPVVVPIHSFLPFWWFFSCALCLLNLHLPFPLVLGATNGGQFLF